MLRKKELPRINLQGFSKIHTIFPFVQNLKILTMQTHLSHCLLFWHKRSTWVNINFSVNLNGLYMWSQALWYFIPLVHFKILLYLENFCFLHFATTKSRFIVTTESSPLLIGSKTFFIHLKKTENFYRYRSHFKHLVEYYFL